MLLAHALADRSTGAHARIEWNWIDVPFLTVGDVESLAAVLRGHVAASAIETLERRHAVLIGRPWAPLAVDIDGQRRANADFRLLAALGLDELSLRTFGHAAAVDVGRAGVRVVVDDEPELARRTAAAIRELLRPRRRRALGPLTSDWLAPAGALLVPVAASLLDAPGDPGAATWAGLVAAALQIAVWGWWRNRIWLARCVVAGKGTGDAPEALPLKTVAVPLPAGTVGSTPKPAARLVARADAVRHERGTMP
jgi:hypothetical protein